MKSSPGHKPRFAAWLLAAMLLWVGAVVVAHELDHALDHHHELCALHHYVDHHGGLPSTHTHSPAPSAEVRLDLPVPCELVSKLRPAPYAVRAPPQV